MSTTFLRGYTSIPWPGTALDSQGIKDSNSGQMMTKCFNDYPTVKVSSAFILYSSMKGFNKDFTVGNTIVHVISSQKPKIESRAVPGHGISKSQFEFAQQHAPTVLSIESQREQESCIDSLNLQRKPVVFNRRRPVMLNTMESLPFPQNPVSEAY